MEISLLAIDIDGTLVAHGDSVSRTAREAVRRASECGLRPVLATGRRYRTTRLVIDQIGLPLPAICLGGALTKGADGATLHRESFAPAQIAALAALARRHQQALALQRDSHAEGGPDFIADGQVPWNPNMRHYMAANGDVGVVGDAADCEYHDISMVGCFGERPALAELQREVDAVGEFGTVLVESKKTPGWYLEIILRHVDKWAALRRYAGSINVPETAICAVGDALNDLPMLRGAALGVAMGNAEPAVKAAAQWVTGSSREEGVAMLVERLVEDGLGDAVIPSSSPSQ